MSSDVKDLFNQLYQFRKQYFLGVVALSKYCFFVNFDILKQICYNMWQIKGEI